ncbi:hydroxysqualene dehydroxylase HpnE [Noviherbaspirillum sp.]|uniref:hydroxysqualene dehydroxylase HpnE n=1 Tax=Noviherbaspirillum sp. TaxID=1926288 RepID=UPI002D74C591|nr:hydroxysqualene dehydroxylase HpnE [Noviherbaspirillum sp.]HZW23435.1 hydroxysqualene dehydroxylase HpnE [Noviherbaspirillum sp.]
MMRKVAVIGGGWAGCAAGVELASTGAAVTLFESARTLGGRARVVDIDGRQLDNGQHILLGAYSESLRLMETVGLAADEVMLRLPLQMRYPAGTGMDFVTPRLPAPLHMLAGLLRASGLDRTDKLALARFSTTARWMDWTLYQDCSVSELLDRYDQTERLTRLMWRPLCVAALNTPPERASAQVFLHVLRDSLGARRAASDMLIPRVDLTALFPQHAGAFIEGHGGTLRLGAQVRRLVREDAYWRLEMNGAPQAGERFDAVVIATPPGNAASLLEGHAEIPSLSAFDYEPITTCYLQYEQGLALDHAFFALVDNPEHGEWGQFVFDRGRLDPARSGLLAVVVSASREAITPGHDTLAASLAAHLAKAFRRPELMHPLWSKIITEKRGTFSCRPSLSRPANDTGISGLALAGDYTACDYPATLESATRSGVQAARIVLDARS